MLKSNSSSSSNFQAERAQHTVLPPQTKLRKRRLNRHFAPQSVTFAPRVTGQKGNGDDHAPEVGRRGNVSRSRKPKATTTQWQPRLSERPAIASRNDLSHSTKVRVNSAPAITTYPPGAAERPGERESVRRGTAFLLLYILIFVTPFSADQGEITPLNLDNHQPPGFAPRSLESWSRLLPAVWSSR